MRPLRIPALLLPLAAAFMHVDASAAGSCTVTSVAFTGVTYNNTALTGTGTVNYTCTRTSNGTDGSPITLRLNAGPGSFYAGNSRNAGNGGNRVAYSLATTAAWGDGLTAGLGNGHTISVAFQGGQSTTSSGSFAFTFSMAGSLNPLSGLVYTDTVAITGTCTTAKFTPCTVIGSSIPISITVPTSCSVSTPPGTLNLGYTSFQTTSGVGNVSFAAQCSNGGPYRMSVTPTSGTVLGVNYNLKLGTTAGSATDISSSTTYNLTGNGSPVTYYINATAAQGQSGTCATGSCLASSPPHTLNVEY
ncbi:spore coat protein U domain-containing protein [Ramlibacter sp. Leaf400]|uniref:spore coat protein U domain-containing protein n=1 Tax=Ramlibacter sp. Leaf400 TaxID=1736365 RepID=UPI0006FD2882|nr:spore coat protein U domain-containing protein [Ramlibacter sp. Leaf400]KQT14091.1 hypothetical protein ASG30_00445 [Ramlibacter sp. Leaf400]